MKDENIRLAIRYPFCHRPGTVRVLKAGERAIDDLEYSWPEQSREALIEACRSMAETGFDAYARKIGRNGLRALTSKD